MLLPRQQSKLARGAKDEEHMLRLAATKLCLGFFRTALQKQ